MTRLRYISILVSTVGLVLTLLGHYELGTQFNDADGKTQALYSLKTLPLFEYSLFGFVSLFIAILALIRKEPQRITYVSIIVAVLTILFPFMNIWKLWA